MAKSNYPEWVLKYKSKGIYVNKVGDTYYLYRAHCIYDKTTKKNKRISDGYIGRVTEDDGFIPVKDKVSGPVEVLDYGLFYFLYALLLDSYNALKKSNKKYCDSIMSLAILNYLNISLDYYHHTALPVIFKKTHYSYFDDDITVNEAARICLQLNHFVNTRISSDEWHILQILLPSVHLIKINGKFYMSPVDDQIKSILKKYNMEMKYNGKNI